ncbi:unnamed protein product [Caenorhabditis bovis]|uniref:Uncharacterized protein n=1 Tax=Caenorhabditis bovis TaxID=2654633 RepID=A0A8S1E1S9_9PELO|nr:unnamed protein product [Caenorhabditis bovis]
MRLLILLPCFILLVIAAIEYPFLSHIPEYKAKSLEEEVYKRRIIYQQNEFNKKDVIVKTSLLRARQKPFHENPIDYIEDVIVQVRYDSVDLPKNNSWDYIELRNGYTHYFLFEFRSANFAECEPKSVDFKGKGMYAKTDENTYIRFGKLNVYQECLSSISTVNLPYMTIDKRLSMINITQTEYELLGETDRLETLAELNQVYNQWLKSNGSFKSI